MLASIGGARRLRAPALRALDARGARGATAVARVTRCRGSVIANRDPLVPQRDVAACLAFSRAFAGIVHGAVRAPTDTYRATQASESLMRM